MRQLPVAHVQRTHERVEMHSGIGNEVTDDATTLESPPSALSVVRPISAPMLRAPPSLECESIHS